jgi:hypothetical protein
VRAILLERARNRTPPLAHTPYEEVAAVIEGLRSLDPEAWAASFSPLARRYEERAAEAEAAGRADEAREGYLLAYEYYRCARYPGPSSPGKLEAYRCSLDVFLRAARFFDPPLERVEIPSWARPGEGGAVVCYLRKPRRLPSARRCSCERAGSTATRRITRG